MKRFLKYDTEIVKKENSPVDLNGLIKENIVGGGSSVKPDWNQNDSTQPDYIKNRPFYMDNHMETVLVEESTVPFVDAGGIYSAKFPSTFEPTVGETYKVYWDGTAYECICVDFIDKTVIGNQSIVGAGSDTGEPFIMAVKNGVEIQIAAADTSSSHTFSISGFAPVAVKIDRKYLPSPLIIDPTNLPTDSSGWGELYEKIDSAYKDRREILLSANSDMLPCVSWYNGNATFIYSNGSRSTLCVYTLIATPNNGGSLEKRIIAMKAEVS